MDGKDVPLARDLASDRDHVLFFSIQMTQLNTILVSISSFSRPKTRKIRKLSTELMHGIKVTVTS